MASRCEDGTVTGDFLDELPNFHIDTFPSLKNIQEYLPKSRKVMLKNSLRGKKTQILKKKTFYDLKSAGLKCRSQVTGQVTGQITHKNDTTLDKTVLD